MAQDTNPPLGRAVAKPKARRSRNSSSKSRPYFSSLQRPESGRITRDAADATPHWQWLQGRAARVVDTYTIFEGTSEIQRLVIARSISGIHIR
jgi:hypothetical protein